MLASMAVAYPNTAAVLMARLWCAKKLVLGRIVLYLVVSMPRFLSLARRDENLSVRTPPLATPPCASTMSMCTAFRFLVRASS